MLKQGNHTAWVTRALGTAFLTALEEKCLSVGAAKPIWVAALGSPAGACPSLLELPGPSAVCLSTGLWEVNHSTSGLSNITKSTRVEGL